MENERIRHKLQKQMYDREVRGSQDRDLGRQASEKLRALHQERPREHSLHTKEDEYFERYSNYCHHLAEVVDPLNIKKHLEETEKYL
jgi:hypothetical protein